METGDGRSHKKGVLRGGNPRKSSVLSLASALADCIKSGCENESALELTPELVRLWRQGKLDQECPKCGRLQAASHYCSKCFRATTLADLRQHSGNRRKACLALQRSV